MQEIKNVLRITPKNVCLFWTRAFKFNVYTFQIYVDSSPVTI